jgi:hypothetical protein
MLQKTIKSQIMNQVHDFPLPVGNLSIRQAERDRKSPQRDLPLWALLYPYNSCKEN